jgi:GNAT superfamily N-acetyltransferase
VDEIAHAPLIRRADPEDASGIARVQVATWRATYAGILPADELAALDVEANAERWAGWIEDAAEGTLIELAQQDRTVVGFACGTVARDADVDSAVTGELAALYVDPDHQRRGVGGTLHDRQLDAFRKRGLRRAILWVLAANETGVAFYRQRGWAFDEATRASMGAEERRMRLDGP